MTAWLADARKDFLNACIGPGGPITETKGVISIADSGSNPSLDISAELIRRIGTCRLSASKPKGQTAGALFERLLAKFLEDAFQRLKHLRPGEFTATRGRSIAEFDQFAHLSELQRLSKTSKELRTLLGSDYLIKPDVVIFRKRESDANINSAGDLVDSVIAKHTPLRSANGKKSILHASISCKLTIRSDRVQNTRSEALNLVRNRKGKLPHMVAVTAEPLPGRIAAIALGTGDMDCVYHFALPELLETLRVQKRDESLELVETMIEGQRLRDIADLPLDLVV
ncbi:NgoMIV family type II restriction endonuclease [Limimaricola cinnabarinus]|uniref:NgoMIV family type II restriction endonuclease n=1 Tax=Limimaricola cinnabarinus TaxID=1125964 RepID=UPI002FE039D5